MVGRKGVVMNITSHAVGAVVVQVEPETGKVLCANMKYTTPRAWSFRHMMETGEKGESISETLRNGLLHEIAHDRNAFEYSLVKDEPIIVEFSLDEKNPGGTHLKVFFLVKVASGRLRDYEKQDGDACMGPVTTAEINGLIMLTEGKTVPIHVRASKAALVALAVDSKIFLRYQDLILTYDPQGLTEEQKLAIDRYPGKW